LILNLTRADLTPRGYLSEVQNIEINSAHALKLISMTDKRVYIPQQYIL